MKTLLRLQQLDLKIEACLARETEIPNQKNKFEVYRNRLNAELSDREKVCQDFVLEQRDKESEIEQKQEQIGVYQGQLNGVRKNEEYQALLHEIDLHKKQIGLCEERILTIMVSLDDANARLEEDRARITTEFADVDRQCAEIDKEFDEAVTHRKSLESERPPLLSGVEDDLVRRYQRIRKSKRTGAAIVPLNDEVCGGCHMYLPPQVVNEVLGGEKVHSCQHCGRLLYYAGNFQDENVGASESPS